MCSIMGMFGEVIPMKEFRAGFERTASRGPDCSSLLKFKNAALGFHRLSIMGLQPEGMQPFEFEGKYIVCNGEIYGFRAMKSDLEAKGYAFKSDSDCEILLPLFKEKGVAMFKELDAEFAMIIFDPQSGCVVAARDPVGIRPLYYGYDGEKRIAFASEPKNLMGVVEKILPFPPGHYYKDGKFVCYRDIAEVKPENVCNDDVETACRKIREKLVLGIEKRLDSDSPLGFLLSGGLDSSLVCAVSSKSEKMKKPIETFAIGMKTDAIDLKYARQVADFIHSNHHEIIITKEDVISSLEDVISALATFDITTIRASVGMYLLCKAIRAQSNVRVLLTGEISDELFGYKYTDFAPDADEFQKESQKRLRELHMYDVLRADRCISVNSIEARVPFGDLDFVEYVMSLNPQIKMNKYNKGKYLLRHAFEPADGESEYLPREILMREKAAFSDAVGHSLVEDLKEYAENIYTDAEYESKRQRFSHAKPFTKESLLYREIFEKYYPNQSQMIADFWMPNKNWEGCDVNDPSARVLKNYGDSGK